MKKFLFISGVMAGGTAVILGAFGAHALKNTIGPEDMKIFEKAVHYQMYHALALLLSGILSGYGHPKTTGYAGIFFLAGILLFSGSLYLWAIRQPAGIENIAIIKYLPPFGGFSYIAGWTLLLISFIKKPL